MGLAARDSRFAPRSQGPRRLLKAAKAATKSAKTFGHYRKYRYCLHID